MSIKHLLVFVGVISACIPGLAFGQETDGGVSIPSETVRQPPVVVAPKPQVETTKTPSTTNDDDPWHVKSVYHPSTERSNSAKLAFGMQMDLGVPSGGTFALVVSPFLPWLKLDVGGGFNGINGGIVGGMTLDPIRFPIVPTLSCDVGAYMPGKIPGVSKSPDVGYTFEDAMLGLEFGKQMGVRVFFRGGVAHLDAQATGFQGTFTLPTGATLNNVNANVLIPAGKLGFTWMF